MDNTDLDGRAIRVNESRPRGDGPGFNASGAANVKLYVGNLAYETTEDQVRSMFEKHGPISDCFIPTERDTGKSRGFAFVTMAAEDARKAMSDVDGMEIDGRPLRVSESKPKGRGEDRFGGGGYGGGPGGGYRDDYRGGGNRDSYDRRGGYDRYDEPRGRGGGYDRYDDSRGRGGGGGGYRDDRYDDRGRKCIALLGLIVTLHVPLYEGIPSARSSSFGGGSTLSFTLTRSSLYLFRFFSPYLHQAAEDTAMTTVVEETVDMTEAGTMTVAEDTRRLDRCRQSQGFEAASVLV